MRPLYKRIFTLFSTHVKKGPQKAIMGTVTIVLRCYGYPRNVWNSHILGGFVALMFLDGMGTLKSPGISTYSEDVK